MAKEHAKDTPERERKGRGEDRTLAERESAHGVTAVPHSPFGLMRRLLEDLDRFTEGFGPGLRPRIEAQRWEGGETMWVPALDVFEREGQLVIRADVPGLTRDQIKLEVEDDQLVISGERRHEREDRRSGFYRSERSYGTFYRAVPLPHGVNAEHAKATFTNGVLEITIPAPQRPRARSIEIQEGAGAKGTPQSKSA